jgi:hypothetical protein
LTDADRFGQHGLRDRDRFVVPGRAFVELIESRHALIDGYHSGVLPVRVGPERRLDAFVRRVGLRHRLANRRGASEQSLLSVVGLERLALFDAQESQLREHQSIALLHRFILHEFRDPFPVGHASRRHLAPLPVAGTYRLLLRRIRALGPRVRTQLRHELGDGLVRTISK